MKSRSYCQVRSVYIYKAECLCVCVWYVPIRSLHRSSDSQILGHHWKALGSRGHLGTILISGQQYDIQIHVFEIEKNDTLSQYCIQAIN